MRIGVLWLAVFAALHAGEAQACSCMPPTSHISDQLRSAQAGALAIYRARVHTTSPGDTGGKASAEVLEVFKGPLTPGERITLPRGDGVGCGYVFNAGVEYLIYAEGTPTRASNCSRTRPVTTAAEDLAWLRTGKATPPPVALQREVVSCTLCDIESVGGQLISRPGAEPGRMSTPEEVETAWREKRPFLTSLPSMTLKRYVLVGRTWDGRAFELARMPHLSDQRMCVQKLHLRWCKALERKSLSPDMPPYVLCAGPGKASFPCDENKTRQATWLPPEVLPAADACSWQSKDAATCELKAPGPSLPDEAARSPVLLCRPSTGMSWKDSNGLHRCALLEQPRPPSPRK